MVLSTSAAFSALHRQAARRAPTLPPKFESEKYREEVAVHPGWREARDAPVTPLVLLA